MIIVNLNSFGDDFGFSSLRVYIFKRLLSNFRQKFSEYLYPVYYINNNKKCIKQ